MEFKFPDVGEVLTECEIVKWLVKVGDIVKSDETIVQVETDKAVADLPVPVSGKILKINFRKGDIVKVGDVLCVVGGENEKIAKIENKKIINNGEINEIKSEKVINKTNENIINKESNWARQREGVNNSGKILASPAARKMARERGVDLKSISGSGAEGVILPKDLDSERGEADEEMPAAVTSISVQKKYDQFGYIDRIPLKGVRKVIAQNMIKSLRETAPVTSMEDIDVTKLWALRQREKEHFEIKGIKVTFMPFIIKAVISALQKHPVLNSSLIGEEIIVKKYFNIGVAVQTEAGLMVPVVKIAEKKSIAEIAREIQELAEKARTRTIDIMDLRGGTFTITNYGSIGGTYGTPIINLGEAAILGLGRIFDRAVLDSNGKLKNVKILPVSLTFDHQILDGAQAADFLKTLKELLEEPEFLLAEVK
ncbi:MAG: dihydrolipoamide acetyltransferase family protein [Nanoarchaeota archaeon]